MPDAPDLSHHVLRFGPNPRHHYPWSRFAGTKRPSPDRLIVKLENPREIFVVTGTEAVAAACREIAEVGEAAGDEAAAGQGWREVG